MVLVGVEMETVFWPDQDQLRVAGTGLVLHTEGGLLEARIETKDFRLQCGESTPRLVRCGRHYVKKYFITNMSMFCIGLYSAPAGGCLSWRLASTRDHELPTAMWCGKLGLTVCKKLRSAILSSGERPEKS